MTISSTPPQHTNTHMDIDLYIYRFIYRYTVLLYTTCKDELYFCPHNSYNRTHTLSQTFHFIYMMEINGDNTFYPNCATFWLYADAHQYIVKCSVSSNFKFFRTLKDVTCKTDHFFQTCDFFQKMTFSKFSDAFFA